MRRARRGERGQSFLLAVVGLVVLAIGMYTTYNLSRAVYEKIELQNAADSAAYSLATLEARSFNFIAFANRAQVANYVAMLEMQSLLSWATFAEAYTGWWSDCFLAAANLIDSIPGGSGIAAPLRAMGEGLYYMHEAASSVVDTLDTYVPAYIRKKGIDNAALYAASLMHAAATSAQILDGASDIIAANDPDARQHDLTWALRGLNTLSYWQAFDLASMRLPRSGRDEDRARRVMTELVNATRFYQGGAFEPSFIVARAPLEIPVPELSGGNRLVRGAVRRVMRLLGAVTAPGFAGTSKLLTGQERLADTFGATGEADPDRSALSAGDTLVAKDQPTRLRAFREKDSGAYAAGVVSSPDTGIHCRYRRPGDHAHDNPSPLRFFRLLSQAFGGSPDVACEEESRHRWRGPLGGGIQPFLKFNSRVDSLSSEATSFNQPEVWVWLHKRPGAMALPEGGTPDLEFDLQGPGGTAASLDARIGADGLAGTGILEGKHAVARAQVYYHRPGAWHEPPNFFNPFWGARLAPKSAAIDRLTSALPSALGDFLAQNIWMH